MLFEHISFQLASVTTSFPCLSNADNHTRLKLASVLHVSCIRGPRKKLQHGAYMCLTKLANAKNICSVSKKKVGCCSVQLGHRILYLKQIILTCEYSLNKVVSNFFQNLEAIKELRRLRDST